MHNHLYARKNGLLIKNYLFSDFCDEYLSKYSAIVKRERSIKKDKTTIRKFREVCKDIIYVNQFNDATLALYISARKKAGKQELTINRELGTLKSMQAYAFRNNYLDKNYSPLTKNLKPPKNKELYIPSDIEIEVLFDNIYEPYYSACLLALYHGLRRGEVCHLELSDFDFEKDTIKIQKKPHLNWQPKNETSERIVPIHPKLKKFLQNRANIAAQKSSAFICFFDDGRELNDGVLSAMILKLKKAINIKNNIKTKINKVFNFHSLRHKFITTLINKGIPVKKVSSIVGHSSIKMTESIYYHYTNDEKLADIAELSFGGNIDKFIS